MGQFLVETDGTVTFGLGAFFLVRTAGAVLTLEEFLRPAIAVALNRNRAEEKEFFVVWTEQISVFVDSEVDSTIRVVLVLFVSGFFLIHGEFHVFFHSLLFTKEIVIEAAISGIAHGILRIKAVMVVKSFHKGLKTVHIRRILLDIVHRNVFVADPQLHIVCRQQLIVTHIVPLDAHKRCVFVCFGVAIALLATDFYVLGVTFQPLDILQQFIIQPQGQALAVSASPYHFIRFQCHDLCVFLQYVLQILYRVLFALPECYPLQLYSWVIHCFQNFAHLHENFLPACFAALLPHPGIPVRVCRDFCPIYVYMPQIHRFFLKYVRIDIPKDFLYTCLQLMVDEIADRHVAWRFFPVQQPHKPDIRPAQFLYFPCRFISFLHERKQYHLQQCFRAILWPTCFVLLFLHKIFF